MKQILFTIFLIFNVFNFAYADELINVEVIKVNDGDTIKVIYNNEIHNIRFLGVDCFETGKINRAYKQAYLNEITIEEVVKRGKFSKQLLQDYLKDTTYIKFEPSGKDVFNRDIGILYKGDVNINNYMIEKGKCIPYEYNNKK